MNYDDYITFEWDDHKASINEREHGDAFARPPQRI